MKAGKAAKAPYQPVEFSDSDDDTTTTTKATVPQKQKTAAAPAAVPPQQTKNLFDSDEDEADDNPNTKKSAAGAGKSSLSINKAYANRYDQVKRTKELQQLTAKYGDRTLKQKSTKQDDDEDNYEFSSSSASENDVSSEDESTMERKLKGASGLKERQFAEVFLKLRQKDPSILDKSAKFFTGEEEEDKGEGEGVKTGAKPFLLKDEYQRAIQATEGKSEAEIDTSAPIADPSANLPLRTKERRMLSEQEAARKQRFLSAVNGNSGGNEDEEDTGLVLLATAPKKAAASSTLKEKEQNESAAKQLLSAAFRSSSQSKKSSSGKSTKDEEEEANEAFLEKFFVQELWRDDANDDDDEDRLKGDEVQRELTNWKDLAAAEQDEIFFDNAEQWERDYQNRQFRHEEGEDAFTVKTYPRAAGAEVTGTLRKQDTSRKDARARKEARREEMARRDVEELKRLKTLKKKEIDEQKRLIASIAGIKNSDKIPFTLEDLQKDFDPEEFDRKMKMMFDDNGEYDGEEDDDLNSDADDAQEAALLDALLGAEDEYADDPSEDTQSSADPTTKNRSKGVTKKLEKPTWDDELFKVASSAAAEDVDGTLFGDSLEETILNSKKFRAEGDPKKKKASKQSKRGGSETAEDAGQLDAEYALLYPMEALKKLEEEAELESDEDEDDDDGSSDRKADPSAKKKRTLSSLQEKLDKTVDEYFKLHYDKALDQGNLKTRFKYRTVPSCTFGLTDEDVLVKDDRELNMLSPMSNYASFLGKHENEVDERKALWRRRNIRTLSASRTSRKYGNVQNTMLFKVAEAAGGGEGGDDKTKNDGAVDEEQGAKIVERLRSRNQQLFSQQQQQPGSGVAARGGASLRPPPPSRGEARGSKPFPQQQQHHQQSFHRGGGGGGGDGGRPYVAHGRGGRGGGEFRGGAGGRGGVQWGRGRGGTSFPGSNNNNNNKKRPRED